MNGRPGLVPRLGREPRHAVVVLSGGLDSTVVAYRLHAGGARLTLLSVDYGQRHRDRELDCARRTAGRLPAVHRVVDLSSVAAMMRGSALTDPDVAVPDGHYTDTSMRATVVAHRNALLLDVAVAQAVVVGADAVAFGAHAGDHPVYPDCRPAFVAAYQSMVLLANDGFLADGFAVLAPLLRMSKAEIVAAGARLGVPFADTWSCYRGRLVHCGRCGTCVERREAFTLAGVPDPTEYAGVG